MIKLSLGQVDFVILLGCQDISRVYEEVPYEH
jgi:hypothetical protein